GGSARCSARRAAAGAAPRPCKPPRSGGVSFPALLETARGMGAPSTSRLRTSFALRSKPPIVTVGSDLHCEPGSWAGDLVEAFLYRAPLAISHQWMGEGGAVQGATRLTLHARGAGV